MCNFCLTTIHWTVTPLLFASPLNMQYSYHYQGPGASLGHFLSTILLSFPSHPFQNTKFWRKKYQCLGLRLWYFEHDILWNFGNASSDNLTSVKWNRHCAQLVEEPFWQNSLQEGFSSSRVHICWNCWIMCEVGRHTLLVIYYLLSSWPVVWPPLLLLGRGEDSTPAFISGNGERIILWNFFRFMYHFSGRFRLTLVVALRHIKM